MNRCDASSMALISSSLAARPWGASTALTAWLGIASKMTILMVSLVTPWYVSPPLSAPTGHLAAQGGSSLYDLKRSNCLPFLQWLVSPLPARYSWANCLAAWLALLAPTAAAPPPLAAPAGPPAAAPPPVSTVEPPPGPSACDWPPNWPAATFWGPAPVDGNRAMKSACTTARAMNGAYKATVDFRTSRAPLSENALL